MRVLAHIHTYNVADLIDEALDAVQRSGIAWQHSALTMNFALRPRTHRAQIRACLRGIRDGLTGT
jgi:hypothetical protein